MSPLQTIQGQVHHGINGKAPAADHTSSAARVFSLKIVELSMKEDSSKEDSSKEDSYVGNADILYE